MNSIPGHNTTTVKTWLTGHKQLLRLTAKIAALVIILWVLFGICFGLHRISGPAMAKSLADGDLLLYSRLASDYQSGDAVIYEHDGNTYVSRILAKTDDLIEIDKYGHLALNGSQISDEIAYTPEQRELIGPASAFRVPSDGYYVLNDNLDSLEDSRSFGAIPRGSIKGKIIGVLRTRSI